MMDATAPIGFIDSGVGGLTVVREALRQLPHENVLFLGDQARLPYGPRPAAQVRSFTWQMVNYLRALHIKALVIACNTATAAAWRDVQAQLDIPVIGVIVPGARAAVKVTTAGRIGVVATEGTVASGAYDAAIHQQNSALTVHSMAAPKFVSLVESNEYKSDLARRVVADTLAPLAAEHPDTVIMGCTHYPLLRPFIQAALGDDVTLIDPGRETVVELATVLDYLGLANRGDHDGDRSFYTTASPTMFADIASDWLGLDDLHAQHVNIEGQPDHFVPDAELNGAVDKTPESGQAKTLVVASKNPGKVREFVDFFAPRGITVRSLADFDDLPTVNETGTTFLENARLKAHGYSEALGLPVIADDSGLMVDALDGAPGVLSARYAGDHNDAANNAKMLANLAGVPTERRTAHFHTTLVWVDPERPHDDVEVDGEVNGRITVIPAGDNGFGYDPFFYIPEQGQTMAEMSPAEKNRFSHRGNALRELAKLMDAQPERFGMPDAKERTNNGSDPRMNEDLEEE